MITTAEQLASVRTAIASVEIGVQEVTLADGRKVRYADLETLYQRERDLIARLGQESRPGGRVQVGLGSAG